MRTIKFVHDRIRRNRKDLYDALTTNAFPNSNQKPFFATVYQEPFHVDGWKLYDPIAEFGRMVGFYNVFKVICIISGSSKQLVGSE